MEQWIQLYKTKGISVKYMGLFYCKFTFSELLVVFFNLVNKNAEKG